MWKRKMVRSNHLDQAGNIFIALFVLLEVQYTLLVDYMWKIIAVDSLMFSVFLCSISCYIQQRIFIMKNHRLVIWIRWPDRML